MMWTWVPYLLQTRSTLLLLRFVLLLIWRGKGRAMQACDPMFVGIGIWRRFLGSGIRWYTLSVQSE